MAAAPATVESPPEDRPALASEERADLRARIRDEIARARPKPVARRTLELMAEAAAEPAAEPPGYRILDRHGRPRLRSVEGGEPLPFTLADLVESIRERHPALFLPPLPEPAPAPAPARDASVRAATARFVETQSERARALAERSSVQGRALAQSAAGTYAGLRARLGERFGRGSAPRTAVEAPRPPEAVPQPAARVDAEPDAATTWNERVGWIGPALRGVLDRLRPGRDDRFDAEDRPRRLWFAGTAAAALMAVAAAGLVLATRTPSDAPPASADRPPPAGRDEPPATARPAPGEGTPAGPQAEGERPAPDTPEQEAAPGELTGPVQVVDTATLRIGGRLVRLFGVETVRGAQGGDLARYIGDRPVSCQPVAGSEAMNCQVNGRDLSEVVLFNGGGRASSEATPELVAAEDRARSERLGIWKR